jgi:hypothetical protein
MKFISFKEGNEGEWVRAEGKKVPGKMSLIQKRKPALFLSFFFKGHRNCLRVRKKNKGHIPFRDLSHSTLSKQYIK